YPKYISPKINNKDVVESILKASVTNLKYTIDSVLDFMTNKHPDMKPKYQIFKEYFTVCWAGVEKVKKNATYLSRVDIELINEQVKIFYSASDEVSISYIESVAEINDYVIVGVRKNNLDLPFGVQKIILIDAMISRLTSEIILNAPDVDNRRPLPLYNYY